MENHRVFFVSLCFLFIVMSRSDAQRSIRGSLVDAESGEPIPFATIGIKGSGVGVVSNLEGDFSIPVRYRSLNDSIFVSCIGYEREELPLSALNIDSFNRIEVWKANYDLPSASIAAKKLKKLSAVAMVRKAVKRISDNYPDSPFSYFAYYRDYQKRDDAYINLNEAIVEILDQGFHTDDRLDTEVKLYEYRSNNDFEVDPATAIAYDNKERKFIPQARLTSFGGNELSILMIHDAIRNQRTHSYSFLDTFRVSFVKNHKFRFLDPVKFGEKVLHCIAFDVRPTIARGRYEVEGKIYIERENFAIHKLTYTNYELRDTARQLLYEIQLEYAEQNGRMFLNYLSFQNLFYLAQPPLFTVRSIELLAPRSFGSSENVMKGRNPPILEVRFNRRPDLNSALDKENYQITIGEREIEVVSIDQKEPEIIQLGLNPIDFRKIKFDFEGRVAVEFGAIYDLDQNLLNEPEYLQVRQFRELFRQKVNHDTEAIPVAPLVNRDTTLRANLDRLIQSDEAAGFWMNSPLKN